MTERVSFVNPLCGLQGMDNWLATLSAKCPLDFESDAATILPLTVLSVHLASLNVCCLAFMLLIQSWQALLLS